MVAEREDRPVGILITQGRVALFLSIVSVMTILYQGSRIVLDSQFRIAALEQSQNKLTEEIKRLSVAVTDLSLVLKEVQVRQESTKEVKP